ncbi:MAG: hypothetical protein E7342_01555 [Clostridiales bacterium]|nr:hypothetical protein [Clostridiales bacterium]
MTVNQLAELLNANKLNIANGDKEVVTGYAGDLLSFVMGRAPEDSAWFTIMTNLNILAVATLTDVAVVVVCEGAAVDNAIIEKAKQQEINLIKTEYDVFNAIKRYLDAI